ncbi:MAG: SU10 major capsid protein, partial [Cetobacterium sp.]|uniref:SU10 major capsid protein n=1 Tax=Cetobacterium sp. TaxID=2071632 RepID=UPI003EE4C13D
MAITKMASYDLKGNKLSFAEWITNLSPTETPFVSMIGKEAISQTKYQWQTDTVPKVRKNACKEGSVPAFDAPYSTHVVTNTTQIFRRAVSVSDTANVVAYYGRGKEIGYQMEKAGLELKRDIEVALLDSTLQTGEIQDAPKFDAGTEHANNQAGKTAGFAALCLKKDGKDKDTGAVLVTETATANVVTEKELFDTTYNLYLANSKANVIMFHPKHAEFFTGLIEQSVADVAINGNRMKMFDSMDEMYNAEVDTIIDPLGQRFALIPNRLMPEKHFYFFNPSDWTQMVLRAPKKIQLAKQGSSEEWMIECELGLRHRNPASSAILKIK